MPQPRNQQTPGNGEAPATDALTKGAHNPFLQGLIQEGEAANKAIQGWYETRDNLRTQARMAVSTGFCSKEQAEAVKKLWPMPNRTKKAETTTSA
jgi:hypothetical protein